mmetsp:Transcript_72061/g.150566  ORF Transcript_72061/g.150566 Transcript_72061/m.150566 type:complete len:105 (-) Transcript_72061:325-639(-)
MLTPMTRLILLPIFGSSASFPHADFELLVKQAANMMQNSHVPTVLRKHLNLDVEDAKIRFANNVQKATPLIYGKHRLQAVRQLGKLLEDRLARWQGFAGEGVLN